jgi:hypothetical protein
VAVIVLATGLVGLLAVPLTILSRSPDLTTRTGRHLLAGSLALVALVAVLVLVCLFPLRRGETWALWAVATPLLVLGLPVFIVDAMYVPARNRFATLLPQAIGDLFTICLLAYLAWAKSRKDH